MFSRGAGAAGKGIFTPMQLKMDRPVLCGNRVCCAHGAVQAVTNFATTANGVLASTFMLYSVGLGAGAIPTAGALNWVLKDGLGQMGTLLFGKAIAHNFDIHSKTWYFMSFLLLSTATGGGLSRGWLLYAGWSALTATALPARLYCRMAWALCSSHCRGYANRQCQGVVAISWQLMQGSHCLLARPVCHVVLVLMSMCRA